jgi:hypothetical protein
MIRELSSDIWSMVAASILIASETVGGDTTASTVTETPVTLESIAVALLGLLVAIAIVDCTDVAISVSVWMLTSTMTLPDATVRADAVPTDAERAVTSTADGWTPAAAAIALAIWVRTLGVNEEIWPAT